MSKESGRQGRGAVFTLVDPGIEFVDAAPLTGFDVAALVHANIEILLRHIAALLAQVLALARTQARQKIVEIPIVVVLPVKLNVAAQHDVLRSEVVENVFFGEQNMPGTQFLIAAKALNDLHQACAQPLPFVRVVNQRLVEQEARPGRRRIRNRSHQLGVVVEPAALIGVDPSVIEHQFAVGIGFDVAGDGRD